MLLDHPTAGPTAIRTPGHPRTRSLSPPKRSEQANDALAEERELNGSAAGRLGRRCPPEESGVAGSVALSAHRNRVGAPPLPHE